MIKRYVINVLFITTVFSVCMPYAMSHTDTYYDKHDMGWHWYDDPQDPIEETPSSSQKPSHPNANEDVDVSAKETMEALQKEVQETMDAAVLNPTAENVEKAIAIQNKLMQNSAQFAKTWQAVLLSDPSLNYQTTHPTNQIARQVYLDHQNDVDDTLIKAFFKDKGLFLFYKSTCPYCKKFAPIISHFSEQYGVTLIPITLDGIALPELPNSRPDNGQAQKFGVTVEPSLFVVDPYTNKAMPVAYGLVSEQTLKTNIVNIMQHFKGD